MCGEKAARQLNFVRFQTTPYQMTLNILIDRIARSQYYSIQLDETTDVADLANLLVYFRYEYDGASHEDFTFFHS